MEFMELEKPMLEKQKKQIPKTKRAYANMLLEFCPNIMILFDGEGRFVMCTKALLEQIGKRTHASLQNRSYRDMLPDIMAPEGCAALIFALDFVVETKKNKSLFEYADFGAGGEPKYYHIDIRAAASPAEGIIAAFTDMTECITEKMLSEAANRAKSDYMIAASRDIRGPLDTIAEMTENLSRTELSETQQEYLANIKRSSDSLTAIIDKMIDFSKIEECETGIKNGYYSPRELFESLYAMFWPLFRTKNLEFYYSVSKTMPEVAYGDDKHLKQALANVLANGLKYTPEGHVEFFAWMSDEHVLHVGVHDTGVGIRQKDIEKLYLPPEQPEAAKKPKTKSKTKKEETASAGLAISRKLCEMMNGEFAIESTYGAGTTFSIHIPCKKL